MRIAQVNLQPDYGGAERYTLLLSDGLRERGHAVTMVCHPRGRLKRDAESRGLPVETATCRSQLQLSAAMPLAIRLRRARPEVVHLQTSKEYVIGAIAARWARVPVVVASRHMLVPVKPTMRALFRTLNAVVVLSNAVRYNLVLFGVPKAKIELIYAGIDANEFVCAREDGGGLAARAAMGVPAERLLVGMAGRMVAGKGHACLIDAMALVAKQGVPATLALAGEGPLRGELAAQARSLGIAEQVLFTGFQPNLAKFMAALDLFVMASTCEEVMPLVIMEAMAAGCPILATDVGGVREIIEPGRTGLLVPPGNASEMAGSILCLTAAPGLRATLSAAGRAEVIKRFTLPRMVMETERLYQRLLASKSEALPDKG